MLLIIAQVFLEHTCFLRLDVAADATGGADRSELAKQRKTHGADERCRDHLSMAKAHGTKVDRVLRWQLEQLAHGWIRQVDCDQVLE